MYRAAAIVSGKWALSERSIANATLDAQVAAIHAATKRSYGGPRIVRDLHALGVRMGRERVRKKLEATEFASALQAPLTV